MPDNVTPTSCNDFPDERMLNTNERLIHKIMPLVPELGRTTTAIKNLILTRWDDEGQTDTCFYSPSIGLILQGRKKSTIGSETVYYGAFDSLVNGVDMPSKSTILEASAEKPLLAISLSFDRSLIMELAADIPPTVYSTYAPSYCMGVSIAKTCPDMLDAFSRLVDVLASPAMIPLMAPLLIKEILTRTLMGPHGGDLRKLYTQGSHSSQVGEAITWLRSHYTAPLRIDELAGSVNMPTSTFHRQFKKVTSLSPLQFQKCLRLYEAKRLMLAEAMDANNAGRSVGYENAQQFNREYKRLFGEPPHRDLRRIRENTALSA